MLRSLGFYLIKNRHATFGFALLFALLPFVGLPTVWLSLLLIGLITLHKGEKEGAIVLVWMALPSLALCFVGQSVLLFSIVVARALIIWLLAGILRRSASWVMVLQCAALLGIGCILLGHVIVPDITAWWTEHLTVYWHELNSSLGLQASAEQSQELLITVAKMATGVLVASIFAFDLFILLLARGWQAILFNPGGLRKELYQVRMGRFDSIFLLFIVGTTAFGYTLSADILPIALLPFVIAGLSLIHAKLALRKNIRLPLLIGLYISFALFVPYVGGLLAFLGVVDSWFDFRVLRADSKKYDH